MHRTVHLRLKNLVEQGRLIKTPVSGGPHDLVFQLFRSSLPFRDGSRRAYREPIPKIRWRRPSLQLVIGQGQDGCYYGDADIDLAPPVDVLGGIIHFFEILVPGKTDHRKLAKVVHKEYSKWQKSNPWAPKVEEEYLI